MPTTAIHSRMGRRIALAMLGIGVLPLMALTTVFAVQAVDAARDAAAARLALDGQRFALQLAERLGSAEALARALTPSEASADPAALRSAVARSPALRSIAFLEPGTLLPGMSPGTDATRRMSGEAGQSFLVTAGGSRMRRGLYLVRGVRIDRVPRLALIEISPQWLWAGASADRLLVVEQSGDELFGPADMPPAMLRMFAAHADSTGAPRALAWQAAATEWRGSLAGLIAPAAIAAPARWAIVAREPRAGMLALAEPLWRSALLVALLAIALALGAAAWLCGLYLPALQSLQQRLNLVRDRQFVRKPLAAPDEFGDAANALIAAECALDDEFRALATIGEIDRLLLGPAALEQVVDAVLPRVQAVTGCDAVGVALLDADAPIHARVYSTSRRVQELPVTRVTLDPDMLATLDGAQQGITVARCEEDRHSLLKPLRELGSEFFWLWPVRAGERLLAVLCVGFTEPPAPAPEQAARGAAFAARLAIALSNSERDEQLYRQAHFDALTGLPNRLLFRDRLAQEFASATAGLSRGALLYVDLDHFKKVNDTVGHGAGDQLLIIVAQRLRSCVKEGDTVARLGGDEFTIILRNVSDPDAARAVAERAIESVQLPVNVAGRDHFVRASVGITLFPDDGASIDELMRNADLAMYRAKESGRGRAVFFDRQMTAALAAAADSGLYRALKRREFALFYQPQFDIASGRLTGVEALLRWHTPRDGMRQPHEFVPAAEESGLIVDIGAWVLDAACQQLAAWRERGIAPPRVALNISAQQLRYAEFPRNVKRTLDKYALPADSIELELTEGVFADELVEPTLERLTELGVRLALDDFGTGQSSLNYLRRFPIHTIKIDRTFLEEIPQNPSSVTLAETIIVMAHAFGKLVVGEGVETVEQLDFLRERGCDTAQGFYLSRPLSATAVTELLESRKMRPDEESRLRATG